MDFTNIFQISNFSWVLQTFFKCCYRKGSWIGEEMKKWQNIISALQNLPITGACQVERKLQIMVEFF